MVLYKKVSGRLVKINSKVDDLRRVGSTAKNVGRGFIEVSTEIAGGNHGIISKG